MLVTVGGANEFLRSHISGEILRSHVKISESFAAPLPWDDSCTPVKSTGCTLSYGLRLYRRERKEGRRYDLMHWSLSCDHGLHLPGSDELNVTPP